MYHQMKVMRYISTVLEKSINKSLKVHFRMLDNTLSVQCQFKQNISQYPAKSKLMLKQCSSQILLIP